jgi:death-on-curing protein
MSDGKQEATEGYRRGFERISEHVENLLHQTTKFHDRIIQETGGTPGIRDEGGLKSAVAAPFASFGGEMLHTTVFDQAGALMRSLIKNHPYIDGNKRVGFAMTEWFLFEQGYGMRNDVPDDEIFNFIIGVAKDELADVGEISTWLEAHSDQASARNFVQLMQKLAEV